MKKLLKMKKLHPSEKAKEDVQKIVRNSIQTVINGYDGTNESAIEILKASYLNIMFDLQTDFSKKWIDLKNKKTRYKEKRTESMILAAIEELIELKRELNLKEWRKSYKKVDTEKVKEELIDVLHFVINIALIWGLDPKSLFESFVQKQVVNRTRQKLHY